MSPFFSAARAANGWLDRIAGRRRVEHGARFARIGIKSQKQELGGDRAEIDHAIAERFRRLIGLQGLKVHRALAGGATSGRNTRSIASSISALDRLQRHDAILHHRRRDPPDHAQPIGTLPREIEPGLEPRQRGEAGRLGDGAPRGVIRHEIELPARFPGSPRPTTGTLQGRHELMASEGLASLHGAHRFRVGKIKLPARQRLRLLPARAAGSPRAYRRPAAGRPAADR